MRITTKIAPCLWFDTQGKEAAEFYTGIFHNSKIISISLYGEAGKEVHQQAVGSVMTVAFELEGVSFTALNGGPQFKFNEAISFQINCSSQQEIDYYWEKLSEGGDKKAQQCGWLKDKYGVSWQVVPVALATMMTDSDVRKSGRVMNAILTMKKLNIDELTRAYSD